MYGVFKVLFGGVISRSFFILQVTSYVARYLNRTVLNILNEGLCKISSTIIINIKFEKHSMLNIQYKHSQSKEKFWKENARANRLFET